MIFACCMFVHYMCGFDVHQLESFCQKLNQKFWCQLALCHPVVLKAILKAEESKPIAGNQATAEQGHSHKEPEQASLEQSSDALTGQLEGDQHQLFWVSDTAVSNQSLMGTCFSSKTIKCFLLCVFVCQPIQTTSKEQQEVLIISCIACCPTCGY